MTFEDAFNTGMRFKLPSLEDGSWADDYWLIKNNENGCKNYGREFIWIFPVKNGRLVEEGIVAPDHYKFLNESNDWFIHPDDEYQRKLNDLLDK